MDRDGYYRCTIEDAYRSLVAMGMQGDARQECQAVLRIDCNNLNCNNSLNHDVLIILCFRLQP